MFEMRFGGPGRYNLRFSYICVFRPVRGAHLWHQGRTAPILPELRRDPITGRWVIIATDSVKRPSDFTRQQVVLKGVRFCPFCPGNELRTPPEVLAYRSFGAANEP